MISRKSYVACAKQSAKKMLEIEAFLHILEELNINP